jgi:PTS system ascorbate-specific IIA component
VAGRVTTTSSTQPAVRNKTAEAAAGIGMAAARWEDAVRAAALLLVQAGSAEPRYADRCVEIVRGQGPYIVVAPGIALAHARPEDGALGVGVAVAVLARPVAFGHPVNDPVDVVFAFASPDKDAHLELLSRLAAALTEGLADRIRAARSSAEARRLLSEVTIA